MRRVAGIRKVLRYCELYGSSRTIVKIAGRTRNRKLRIFFPEKRMIKNVLLIGCGQFGFSTISYFFVKNVGNCFLQCFDINRENSLSIAQFWGYDPVKDWKEIRSLVQRPEGGDKNMWKSRALDRPVDVSV